MTSTPAKKYFVNEIFYSLQGEGGRAGEPSVFVRFRGCNQTCKIETHGFDCDTEFASGVGQTLTQIKDRIEAMSECKWLVLTGGEPGLQVDDMLIDYFHAYGFKLAIETNGSVELPQGLDWVTVSPKVAEHAIRQLTATEVKYVRAEGQGIPVPACKSEFKYLSPAWAPSGLDRKNLEHCISLCLANPEWRLSLQQHKLWSIR